MMLTQLSICCLAVIVIKLNNIHGYKQLNHSQTSTGFEDYNLSKMANQNKMTLEHAIENGYWSLAFALLSNPSYNVNEPRNDPPLILCAKRATDK